MAQVTNSPAPPPPPPKKSNKKLLIAIIAIILIIVFALVIYFAFAGMGNNSSTTPTTTPTPTTSSTPTQGATSTPTNGGTSVTGASSLQYSVTLTNSSGQVEGSYTFYGKTVGSASMIRVEYTDSTGSNMIYIVNGATQQAWISDNGEWTDLSSAYTSQYASWNNVYSSYKTNLASWTGVGDYTYTGADGSSVRIHNISVNPSLPDSLFQHS